MAAGEMAPWLNTRAFVPRCPRPAVCNASSRGPNTLFRPMRAPPHMAYIHRGTHTNIYEHVRHNHLSIKKYSYYFYLPEKNYKYIHTNTYISSTKLILEDDFVTEILCSKALPLCNYEQNASEEVLNSRQTTELRGWGEQTCLQPVQICNLKCLIEVVLSSSGRWLTSQ